MIKKRQKSHKTTIITYKLHLKNKLFAFFLIIIILLFLYLKTLATPLIVSNASSQLGAYASKSLNDGIQQTVVTGVSYNDLVSVVKDKNGDIVNIEADTIKINNLSKQMSKNVLEYFLKVSNNEVNIHLGDFSGFSFLVGVGPMIQFNVDPYGEVVSEFDSKFVSAGINQTYHKLFMNVSINVNAVLPFKTISFKNSSEVLLCETVIVGKIPEFFLNSGALTNMLNLVPEKFNS